MEEVRMISNELENDSTEEVQVGALMENGGKPLFDYFETILQRMNEAARRIAGAQGIDAAQKFLEKIGEFYGAAIRRAKPDDHKTLSKMFETAIRTVDLKMAAGMVQRIEPVKREMCSLFLPEIPLKFERDSSGQQSYDGGKIKTRSGAE